MAAYYPQVQPSAPERAFLSTSAGLIAYNPAAMNASANMPINTTGGARGMGLGAGMSTAYANPSVGQQPMSQYYAPGTTYNQAISRTAGLQHLQAQVAASWPMTGVQPGAIAPMAWTGAADGLGGAATAAGANPALAGGAVNPRAVNAAANEGAIEASTEEAEVEGGLGGGCLGCCGPAARPADTEEEVAGRPAGERVVQYFKSGYNSAAAGASASNGLPAKTAGAPAAPGGAAAI